MEPGMIECLKFIKDQEEVTISKIQINLSVGFSRAGRLLNELKEINFVGSAILPGRKKGYPVDKIKVEEILKNKESKIPSIIDAILKRKAYLKKELKK